MSILPFSSGSCFGGQNELDALFRNSAGPANLAKASKAVFTSTNTKEKSVKATKQVVKNNNRNKKAEKTDVVGSKLAKKRKSYEEEDNDEKDDALERAYEAKLTRKTLIATVEKCKRLKKVKGEVVVLEEEITSEVDEEDKDAATEFDDVQPDNGEGREEEREQDEATKRRKPPVGANEQATPRKLAKDSPEELKKTLFVGNLPTSAAEKSGKKELLKTFKQYGEIDSIRFRSIAFAANKHRKAAFIEKKFHPERHTVNAYIKFSHEDDARCALELNGTELMGHHVRVDSAALDEGKKFDRKRSVFVGNLPLDVEEEALWKAFAICGVLDNVRVVRDRATNLGKGFGYVQFAERSSAELALKLHDTDICGRKVRVYRCNKQAPEHRFSSSTPHARPRVSANFSKNNSLSPKCETGAYPGGRTQERSATWKAKRKAVAEQEYDGHVKGVIDVQNHPRKKRKNRSAVSGGGPTTRVSAKSAKVAKEKNATRKVVKALKKKERKSR